MLRAASRSDAEPISRLAVEVFHTAYGSAFPDPTAPGPYLAETFAPEALVRAIEADPELFSVAEVEGRVAGFIWLKEGEAPACVAARPAVEVSKLYLLPEFHGLGVADELMEEGLRVAKRRGGVCVWLCVWEQNVRAQRFYRRWGFREIGSIPVGVGGVNFNDYVMARSVVQEPSP